MEDLSLKQLLAKHRNDTLNEVLAAIEEVDNNNWNPDGRDALSMVRTKVEDLKPPKPESNVPELLVQICPECGSGDVNWCQISGRPHCNECGYWMQPQFGMSISDTIHTWNEQVEASGYDEIPY